MSKHTSSGANEELKPCPFCGGAMTWNVEDPRQDKTSDMYSARIIHAESHNEASCQITPGYGNGLILFFNNSNKPHKYCSELLHKLMEQVALHWNRRAGDE